MAKAEVRYKLSESGRRASLRAGGDGRREQTVTVELPDDLLDRVTVPDDGIVIIDLSSRPLRYRGRLPHPGEARAGDDDYDAPLTDPVRAIRERLAALDDAEERAAAEAEQRRLRAEAERREQRAEAERWIAVHGSTRLRRLLIEGIEWDAVYRDERLARERPGWQWVYNTPGESSPPRNAPGAALDLLDAARVHAPDARLVYWSVAHVHRECGGRRRCPRYDWQGYAAIAEFLGRLIVFFGGPGPDS